MTTSIGGSATPNTPEILNAIINISSQHLESITTNEITLKKEETNENEPLPPGRRDWEDNNIEHKNINKYHSQFIREGLKMKVKQKIKEEISQTADISLGFDDTMNDGGANLTFEDEERRLRRRERNKVAATKCRNKKKERTTKLIAEGELLEIQNASLKDELSKLEAEKRSLHDLLSQHSKVCVKKRKFDGDGLQTKDKKHRQNPTPESKERTFSNQRPQLDFNQSNMEAFQNYNYNGYNGEAPGLYIKQETEQCNDFYSRQGYFQYGYFSQSSSCLPGYSLNPGAENMCLAL